MIFQFRSITFFGSSGMASAQHMIALVVPLLVLVRLDVRQVKRLPALRRDFKRAHFRLAPVRLVARHPVKPL